MKTMHTAFQLVKENLKENRIKMKNQYDKRAKDLNFKVGDKVLLDVKVIPQENNKKLTAK